MHTVQVLLLQDQQTVLLIQYYSSSITHAVLLMQYYSCSITHAVLLKQYYSCGITHPANTLYKYYYYKTSKLKRATLRNTLLLYILVPIYHLSAA